MLRAVQADRYRLYMFFHQRHLLVTAQVPIAITAARVIVNAFLFMIYILLRFDFYIMFVTRLRSSVLTDLTLKRLAVKV